jgi:hypothetical protein
MPQNFRQHQLKINVSLTAYLIGMHAWLSNLVNHSKSDCVATESMEGVDPFLSTSI